MIIYSNALSKIAGPIMDEYEKEYYKIEWNEEPLDDFYKEIDEFEKLNNLAIRKEQKMDRDRYKCVAVYSTGNMYIYGLDTVEYLLNEGWLIDETIEHDNFVMYIMYHFPIVDEE